MYDCLKFLHIIGATLLLLSMVYSYQLWRNVQTSRDAVIRFQAIHTQTWLIITPLAMIQLASGFSMISFKHYNIAQTWISGSVIGFIVTIISWFGFVYFLKIPSITFEARPANYSLNFKFYRRIQTLMLSVCACALCSMIFLMANKL